MKYFEYIVLLSFFFGAFLFSLHFYRKLRCHHFFRLIRRVFITKTGPSGGETYLPTYYIFETIQKLVRKNNSVAHKALVYLCVGRTSLLRKYLKANKESFLELVWESINSSQPSLKSWEKLVKKEPNNYAALAELASLYWANQFKDKCRATLDNIDDKKASFYVLAKKNYYQAYLAMNEGDMLEASQKASAAIRGFEKSGAELEAAETFILMGTIYRVTVISDVSQLMFNSALRLFQTIKAPAGVAKTYGNLGMLMAISARFEEATVYYEQALEINQQLVNHQAQAEIINQQAWLLMLEKKFEQAWETAMKALALHNTLENQTGQAFSKETLANLAWAKKDYPTCQNYAQAAATDYQLCHNPSAQLDSLYLSAWGLFEQEKLKLAEKQLREIIEIADAETTSFPLANAYNLLGLIYVKENDRRRAKGLFQQALDWEQCHERLGGAAVDFNNIGLIEIGAGNLQQAYKTMLTAFEYAHAAEDAELMELIEKSLETLKGQLDIK